MPVRLEDYTAPVNTWREIAAYVGFGPADSEALRELLPHANAHLPAIADRFYEAVLSNERAASVLQGPEQVERLKGTLSKWMLELLEGPHDGVYWARRRRIGHVHVKVGLPNRYVFGAMNVIRQELLALAKGSLPPDVLWEVCLAIQKVTDVELAVMSGAWMEAHEAQELAGLQAVIVENLPVTVLCLDDQLRVTSASAPPRGPAQSVRAYVEDAVIEAADLSGQLARALDTDRQVSLPRVETGDGRIFRITILPLHHPLARLLVHLDETTDLVAVEARLKEAEHLATLGSLAANVAHEVRNPLAAISATLQVIVRSFAEDDRRRSILDKVQQNVHRLDRLVTDLLSYARPVELHTTELDLVTCAQEALANSHVQARIRVEEPVETGVADAFYLQQILVNLLQNARDAAGGEAGVELIVGPGASLRVSDAGPGIAEEVAKKLFEPFVTTKTRGTGLGLAISRKLARGMGAELGLDTSHGELGGAVFRLSLRAPVRIRS